MYGHPLRYGGCGKNEKGCGNNKFLSELEQILEEVLARRKLTFEGYFETYKSIETILLEKGGV